jgi:hypothetical protein
MPSSVELQSRIGRQEAKKMKTRKTAKPAGPGKRDLLAELDEGFDALAARRQGKRTLRTHASGQIQAKTRAALAERIERHVVILLV